MLIDLDLAKVRGSGPSGNQTGTMEFMAIEVLRKADHTYRHDLESFFYVLLWICARRTWQRWFRCEADQNRESLLKAWYTGSSEQIADAKQFRMHVDTIEPVLAEFPPAFECVKELCREIRRELFPYHSETGMFIGTPKCPDKKYETIIAAFDTAISKAIAEDAKCQNQDVL